MKEAMEKLIKETKELMDDCMQQCMSLDSIPYMDSKEFALMQKSISLMNTSFDLCIKQAEMMDKMNEKLDKLLAKKGKEA